MFLNSKATYWLGNNECWVKRQQEAESHQSVQEHTALSGPVHGGGTTQPHYHTVRPQNACVHWHRPAHMRRLLYTALIFVLLQWKSRQKLSAGKKLQGNDRKIFAQNFWCEKQRVEEREIWIILTCLQCTASSQQKRWRVELSSPYKQCRRAPLIIQSATKYIKWFKNINV